MSDSKDGLRTSVLARANGENRIALRGSDGGESTFSSAGTPSLDADRAVHGAPEPDVMA